MAIAMIRPLPVFFLRCAPSISTLTSSSSGSAARPASISGEDIPQYPGSAAFDEANLCDHVLRGEEERRERVPPVAEILLGGDGRAEAAAGDRDELDLTDGRQRRVGGRRELLEKGRASVEPAAARL